MSALTTCNLCGTTRNETIAEHLLEHHLNEFLSMEYDPQTEVGTIIERAPVFDDQLPMIQTVHRIDIPPADHGSDRYDYVEVDGPDDVPRPEWLTPAYVACQDCRANLYLKWLANEERWLVTVAHDAGCPELARHEGG